MAARGRRLHRQARRADRHRLDGHPGDPGHRRRRATTSPSSSARRNYTIPARNAPLRRTTGRGDQGELSRDPTKRARVGRRLPVQPSPASVALDFRRRSASAIYEALWQEGGFKFLFGSFSDIVRRPAANDTAAEFIRVEDPRDREGPGGRREARCPTDHPYGSKRPPIDTDYFETFNRDNVTLVDLRDVADRRDHARRASGPRTRSYDLDIIVFATGFDAMTGALLKHRHPRPGRRDARATSGRTARGPTSACRSPASRTSSRSPARAARRCSATCRSRSSSTSTGSRDCIDHLRENGLGRIEADRGRPGGLGRARRTRSREQTLFMKAELVVPRREHPGQAAGLHALRRRSPPTGSAVTRSPPRTTRASRWDRDAATGDGTGCGSFGIGWPW